MTEGTVKWFDPVKGYGFITADNKDYFVHYSDILGDSKKYKKLNKYDNVKFNIIGENKAVEVTLINNE